MDERAAQIAALSLPLDRLPDPLPIPTVERPFDVTIRPPGSKSITNRALLLAALADGTSELRGALVDADDAQVMLRAIEQLGARVELRRGAGAGGVDVVCVSGVGGRWAIPKGHAVTLRLGNAGTATRFLAAAALLAPGDSGGIIIDGDGRMRERPIGELVGVLNGLSDAAPVAEYLQNDGFPPVHVRPERIRWATPTRVAFGRVASSQFVSAMLLVGAFMPGGLVVTISSDDLVSRPYVDMTLSLLRAVGIKVVRDDPADVAFVQQAGTHDRGAFETVRIMPLAGHDHGAPRLPHFTLDVEPDASGATYFEAAAALIPGAKTTIAGLDLGPRGAIQGDARFVSVLTSAGARVERLRSALGITGRGEVLPIDVDLADMPDTAMTAAALACFARPTADNPAALSTLRGLRTLRVKETDRLAALQTELRKVGATVDILHDGDDEALRIAPPPASPPTGAAPTVVFDTYNDHRMAMALSLVGLRRPNVCIRNPGCVAKTYPGYWRDFAMLYAPPADARPS